MPNIKTLDAGNVGLQPSEIGVESAAAAGRRGGAFFNQAAGSLDTLGQRVGGAIRDAGDAYMQYEDHREISAGSAAYADLLHSSTVDWNNTAKGADPNDPSVADKWRTEQLEPALDQFLSGFTTQRSQAWAEQHVAQLRDHFVEKTGADMASMAADAVQVNWQRTSNSLAATVYNDPSSLDMAFKSLDSTLSGKVDSSPNLTPAVAARVKSELSLKSQEQIVKSAVLGAISKGGDWHSIADDPKYAPFINQAEITQFERQDRYYQRLTAAADKAAQRDQDYEARQTFNTDLNKLETSLIDNDGNLVATKDHVAALKKIIDGNQRGAALEPGRVSSMLSGLERMIDKTNRVKAAVDDPATRNELTARLFDPENPTTLLQIGIARNDGKISATTQKNLTNIVKLQAQELHDPVVRATMNGAAAKIGRDDVGREKFASFVQQFLPEFLKEKRAGTLPPNWGDLNDEKSLIRQYMKSHERSMTQMMQDRITHGEFGPSNTDIMTATPRRPPALANNPNISWSPSRGRWYDTNTRKAYERDGTEVK